MITIVIKLSDQSKKDKVAYQLSQALCGWTPFVNNEVVIADTLYDKDGNRVNPENSVVILAGKDRGGDNVIINFDYNSDDFKVINSHTGGPAIDKESSIEAGTDTISHIRINFDRDHPITESTTIIDEVISSTCHISEDSNYTQEEFALISLAEALGFKPAEVLSFIKEKE